MSRTWVGVLAFAGGLVAGLLVAKAYAKHTIAADIAGGLGALGFSPETSQKVGDFLAPIAVN